MSSKTPEVSKLGHGNQRPKIELAQAFMPVLITSNFDDDSKMNVLAQRYHFPIKVKSLSSAQYFLSLRDTQGQVTIVQMTLKSNLSKILCLS